MVAVYDLRVPATDGDDEEVTAAAAAIRAELRGLRSALARVEEAVERLPQRPVRRVAERERPARYFRVLVSVYEHGGRHGITSEALGEIGAANGYDPRGLGGFFAGVRAPLRRVDGRVRLTAEGLRLVDNFLQEVAG